MKTLGVLAALLLGLLALFYAFLSGDDGRGTPDRAHERPAPNATRSPTTPDAQASVPEGRGGDESHAAPDLTRSRVEANDSAASRAKTHAASNGKRTLIGTIVDENGPVRGAQVLLIANGEAVGDANSEKSGHFELTFPVPADSVVLRVHGRGRATLEKDLGPQNLVGQQHLGNLFLRNGMFLRGIVVDQKQQPIAGASVQMTLISRNTTPAMGETTHTGTDGRFEFPTAPPGTVTLIARAAGYGETSIEHRNIPDREARLRMAPGADLSVRVVDAASRPVAGVPVTLRGTNPDTRAQSRSTDDEGRVTFPGLLENRWTVRVSTSGFKPGGLSDLRAGDAEALLRLVAWPTAFGSVRTPDGEPAPRGTLVHAVPSAARGDLVAGLVGGAPVAEDGTFRVGDLRPGDYRIRVVAPGFAPTSSRDFSVGDVGEVAVGEIRLIAGGAVRIQLTLDKQPIAGVRGEVLSTAPLPMQEWTDPRGGLDSLPVSDAKGAIVFENLALGSIWVTLRGETTVPTTVGPLRVSADADAAPLAIALERGLRIEGFVRTEGGTRVPRARIRITGERATVPFLQTDTNGAFRSPCLPVGSYAIEASSVETGTLLEAEPVELRLTEETGGALAELILYDS